MTAASLTSIIVAAQLIAGCMLSAAVQEVAQWQKLNWRCVAETNAVKRQQASSKIQCAAAAGGVSGDLVAQWNEDTGVCCVFHYQRVCRLASAATAAGDRCLTFRKLIGSSLNPQSLNSKFVAVYLAGEKLQLENLVCSGSDPEKNRFYPHNVQWNAEGAAFNGVDSYALLNDSEFMSFGEGFTWLLRLKRQPSRQAFLNSVSCYDFTDWKGHVWEFPAAGNVFYAAYKGVPPYASLTSSADALVNDSAAWIDIGVAGRAADASLKIFVGDGFLPASQLTRKNFSDAAQPDLCFLLGARWQNSGSTLHGTVRAVGIANVTATEDEIRSFFATLP